MNQIRGLGVGGSGVGWSGGEGGVMGSVGVEGGGWRRGEDVMGSAVMEGGG